MTSALSYLTVLRLLKPLFFASALLLLSASAIAQNQTAEITGPDGVKYWQYLPPGYNSSTDKFPVVFFLHGLGERGSDLNAVLRNGPPKHVQNGYKFPFILISPQLKSNYGSWLPKYVDGVIEHCKKNLRIDESRIYLTGLSLGGGGVWGYAQDPVLVNKLAAIAPICGHQNSPAKACTIAGSNLPVWAFHGDADNTVPHSKTVSMVNAINECDPAPNPLALKTIYPGVGHDSWSKAYATDNSVHTPNLYQWLLQFRNGGVSVNAGTDKTINLPTNSTTLTGTASGGSISSYAWTKVSGPAVTINNASSATVSLSGLVQGSYVFRLTASNSAGERASDDVAVTVLQVNQSPVANAGADVTITLPTNSLNVVGRGTDADGTVSSYSWSKVSGPGSGTLTGINSATLSLAALVEGTYVFALTVTDNQGATGSDQVTVVVQPALINQAPTASAGNDQNINLPTNTTNVIGSGSDRDGSIASYLWEKVSGPTATLTNATTNTLALSDLVDGSYVFRLTVTDNAGATATDEMSITVAAANQAPQANAGPNVIVTLPTNTTTIQGTGADADGSVTTYTWTLVNGPNTPTLTNANTATLTASSLVEGVYTLRLTVTDDKSSTAYDDVTVTVNAAPVNAIPTANAGVDKTVNLPTNTANLLGSGSDSDGTIASYLWELLSGPSVTMTNTTTATLSVTDLLEGIYTFQLTVTDDDGATSTDEATITVIAANQSPVVNAGADINITLPTNSTNISGSAADTDGSIATYSWSQVNGPSTATLVNNSAATLTVNSLIEGTYTFRLTATDDQNASAFDDVDVIVNAVAANTPPSANAGSDVNINLPVNSVTLTGFGTDNDGSISSYSWRKVSGPSATLVDAATASFTANNLVAGTYVFRLTVVDNLGATGTDDVTVIVQPEEVNQSPIANAGDDKSITLPINSVTLTGSASDPDGSITLYSWVKTNGPAATLAGETAATLTVTDLVVGTYDFELTVTDDKGDIDTDQVKVTVNDANQLPLVSAGDDIIINLPINTATINATASDNDGSISTYTWTQLSGGPGNATLANQSTSSLSVSDLIAGTYTFEIAVVDDAGATSTDQVKVIVNAANQSPIAKAGNNKTITLPTNTATFNGAASDSDGTVNTFTWTQIAGPVDATLANASTKNLTATVSQAGKYTFRLSITDDQGATDYDDVDLTVNPEIVNQAPIPNAGPNVTITLPVNSITIAGSASDNDGSIVNYKWAKSKGPTATISNGTIPTLSVSNLLQGTYIFRLTVTDDKGLTAFDEVTVTVLPAIVNQIPVANAGSDQVIKLPTNTLILTGAGSDADGTITTYLWEKLSGPTATISNETTTDLFITDLLEGVYTFRLTVTDDKGATDTDEIQLTVSPANVNKAPVANAGSDKSIALPTNALNLTGSGIDIDGSIVTYVWAKVSGPNATLTNSNTATVSLSGLVAGDYIFRLTVTDNGGLKHSDDVIIKVLPATANQIPTAYAGPDKIFALPTNSVTLFGSASDADGTIGSYTWTKVSGPAATLTNTSTPNLTVTAMVAGVYVFRLTVTDNKNATATDQVRVTVNAEGVNLAPNANAGADVTITLPTAIATLTGSGSDNDGTVVQYKWTKVSGPGVITSNADKAALNLSSLESGTYVFRLEVKDDKGAVDTDDVQVTVLPQSSNILPVVNAGADIIIIEPENSLSIRGTVSDADGTVTSLLWTQIAGPIVTLADATTVSVTINNLVVGQYKFRLTATDDKSASAFDEVLVTVKSATDNKIPIADAGKDISIKLPENQVSLTGSATDSDGTIASYAWTKLSGPAATMAGASSATLEVTSMQEGVYEFSLTVTDNVGATDEDKVKVTVLPASFNLSPIAEAGEDIIIELPQNSATINGIASDDGVVAVTSWEKISGPEVTLGDIYSLSLSLSNLNEGEYIFRLTVTDDTGLTNFDDVTVSVLPETSVAQPPMVNAGEDVVLQSPENSTVITAIAESSEGLIASYKWTQKEGATTTLENDSTNVLTLGNLVPGSYVFTLTVTDNFGVSASDEIHILVLEEEPLARPRNLFSPDNKGDVSTETWVIDNAVMINDCEVIVYNRQGQKVYSSIGYPTQWDGTLNGSPLPDGAYFYIISCSGKKSQSGSVTIARLK